MVKAAAFDHSPFAHHYIIIHLPYYSIPKVDNNHHLLAIFLAVKGLAAAFHPSG